MRSDDARGASTRTRRLRDGVSIDLAGIDALLFDLDGVVTKTAAVHAAAWKRLFDDFLKRRAAGEPWQPFDADREYRIYVDGKPRRDGVRSFLASRGIALPEGSAVDGPDGETIYGLAARKNDYFRAHLEAAGVEVYQDAVALLHRARAHRARIAVVTASENCTAVLAAAGLTAAFDAVVDGRVVLALGLHGKPAPDTFLEAARRLGTGPDRSVIFEDAIAGMEAGRAGRFVGVIGVARGDNSAGALRAAGATAVVTTLDEVVLVRDGVMLERA